MSRHGRDPDEAEHGLLLRYGIEPNPHADHFYEQELADRICEQASLTPGHNAAWQLARSRLGLGRSPYERPNAPAAPPRSRRASRSPTAAPTATSAPATALSSGCSRTTRALWWCASRTGSAARYPPTRSS